ncbi:MAG: 5'-3' exonuclease [Egibacteraceae bacterium]
MEALSLFDADLRPAVPTVSAAAPPSAGQPSPQPRRPALPRLPVLLAIDGNSLAHRAFHAYPQGLALRGFCSLLAAVADRAGGAGTVVGFDCAARSARRERWPSYKAQRPPKEAALRAVIASAEQLLRDLGVAVESVSGWEADDVLASAAATAEAAGWRCVLATSDRDAYAQVSDATTVLRLRAGLDHALEVTPRRLRAEVGVDPGQYVEFAALRGDVSDNLNGVPGVGRTRAAALLAAYPTVAAAAADPIGCRSVLGRPVGQALLDDLADPTTSRFLRNVDLMTVRRDLPIDLAGCRRHIPPARIEDVLRARGLSGVAGRVAVALGARPDWPPPPAAAQP